MHHRTLLGATALVLALALGGCGGGGGEPPPSGPDRIEPFDPGALAKAAAAPAQVTPLLAGARDVETVTLPPLPAASNDSAPAAVGAPLQTGEGRDLPATATPAATATLLHWQASGRGTQVAALRFVAQGALGVRLGVVVDALPAGALLRFYGADDAAQDITAERVRAIAARNAAAGASDTIARTYWSPELSGAQATLEIEIPAGAAAAGVRLSVPRLSHITAPREQVAFLKDKPAGACQVDVVCSPEFLEQSRSVARIYFVEAASGKAYLCTGTLVNDMASSGTPYLLTASHCIADQATASTVITDWLLRASSCGGSSVDPAHNQRRGGATLLHASARTDVSFLRLDDPAPAGTVYAGSYFGTQALPGTPASIVHHPEGDLQKLTQGTIDSYAICAGETCSTSDRANGTFFITHWQQGATEPGSSGTGAFMAIGSHRYLVGQLYGGNSSCTNPGGADYFGRFDRSYRDALHQWLNP